MRPAETIINRLGGVRAAARLLEKPHSTVADWKRSGFIPAKHQAEVVQKAKANGLVITLADFVGEVAA